MRRETIILVVLGLLAVAAGAGEKPPALRIISLALPETGTLKVFEQDEVVFFARADGKEETPLLRDVVFVLYDEGGDPDREETVRRRVVDDRKWGRPPSSFRFEAGKRTLPIGKYRLLAQREGFRDAEIPLVLARFGYFDLTAIHEKESWRASFHLRFRDVTEKRKAVPVTVRVRKKSGALLDERTVRLAPKKSVKHAFETTHPLRLSSKKKKPDRDLPAAARTGVLKVEPGCRVAFELDGKEFPYPIPLPPEPERSGERDDDAERREDREKGDDRTRPDSPPRDGTRPPRSRGPR
jgi:hypothetical protein